MKQRKNITISPAMLERAQTIMSVRGFDDFSEFISSLIREEHERRHSSAVLNDRPPSEATPPSQPSAPGVRYPNKRRK